MSSLRVYLAGETLLEGHGTVLTGAELHGRTGRRAIAWFLLNPNSPVTRESLAGAVWGEHLPAAWPGSLSALLSKLRTPLDRVGVSIATSSGTHALVLPRDTWIDVEAALASLETAVAHCRAGSHAAAFGALGVTIATTRQPLLAGEEAEWLTPMRERLGRARATALELLADLWLANNEPSLAIEAAAELAQLDPYRDAGHQRLMRAHLQRGDRAKAIQAYGQFRELLSDEIGVDPSPETHALYLEALRS